MSTQQQIDDPRQWRAGDMFEGEYMGHPFSGVVWDDSGYLMAGGITIRFSGGTTDEDVTGHVTRTVEPIPEPTEWLSGVKFADGAAAARVFMLAAAWGESGAIVGGGLTWEDLLDKHGAPVAVSLPHWSDEVDGLRAEAREAVEDFIAHMEAMDRGRITGREVAEHLRRALLAEGGEA